METTLHRQLKEKFCEPGSEIEVKLGRYRIDVVNGDRLMEIQQSGLAAIRDKIQDLCNDYAVDVVKPLVKRKRLIKLNRKNGREVSRRWSPRRGSMLDLFDELIYFTRAFPHPNLRLYVPLIEIEETRYPGHGRRRRWRKNDFVVQDKCLVDLYDIQIFDRAADLHRLLPSDLPEEFDTAELAEGLGVQRHVAQQIGYVLRKCGSAEAVGKRGRSILYRLISAEEAVEIQANPPKKVITETRPKKQKPKKKKTKAKKSKKPAKPKSKKRPARKKGTKKKVRKKKSAVSSRKNAA